MDLQQIRYFVHLAETLNFTEAARRSGVSQPSLTKAIQRLEDELGGRLLHRDGKDSRLTALGRQMQVEFMRLERLVEGVHELAAHSARGRTAVLRIGVAATVGSDRLAGFWAQVLAQLPSVELQLLELGDSEGAEEVLAGRYDACILADAPRPHAKLSLLPLYREHLRLAMAAGHALAGRAVVSVEDLANEPYLDRLECRFRTQIIEHFMNRDAVMRARVQSAREHWVQQLVAAGAGVCVLPEFSLLVEGIVVRPVEGLELYRDVTLAAGSGSRAPMAVRQVVAMAGRYRWDRSSAGH